jgi:hypothetical protein
MTEASQDQTGLAEGYLGGSDDGPSRSIPRERKSPSCALQERTIAYEGVIGWII